MKFLKLGLLFALLAAFQAKAQQWEVGKTYSDPEKLIEFIVGDIPLVISVPHGGTLMLPDVPIRDCKNAVTVTDSRTIELVKEIEKAFLEKYKARPFIVFTNISRKQVDQNREIGEGTCGNTAVDIYWNQFHNYIDTALAIATKKFGKAVYIDLHGHGHEIQRLEIGYGPSADLLRDLEKNNGSEIAEKTSVNNLIVSDKSHTVKDLLIGKNAFGTLIEAAGYHAVPSLKDPYPLKEEKYFNGGYNTRRYTSAQYPNVFGWQIESNYKGVRDPAGRPLFASAFAEVMANYFKTYLKIKIPHN